MTIKLIISDFDGVLMDCKEIHYESLNLALEEHQLPPISLVDHYKKYDGLSSKMKLSQLGYVPEELFEAILQSKQAHTFKLIGQLKDINKQIPNVIKSFNIPFVVASNAIKETVELGLRKLKIIDLVKQVYSNQDTTYPKPNPSIYLKVMSDYGVLPQETLIIEDSKTGRAAAYNSGAHVMGIDSSFGFTATGIKMAISRAENNSRNCSMTPWHGEHDLNIVIPAAGLGSRFSQEGYPLPKPLIDVNGYPMIYQVVKSLNIKANYIFIIQREHDNKYQFATYLKLMVPNCQIVLTDGLTEGAACTTLLAEHLINNYKKLIIANSDQIVNWDSADFMYSNICHNTDGSLVTFPCPQREKKWSYCHIENDLVAQVREKDPISDVANVGIYYFKTGSDYVRYAKRMIEKNIRTNREFYIAPVFNEMILDNKVIKSYSIQRDQFSPTGTPQDLEEYLRKA